MHPNARLINRFYEAFTRRDWAGKAACCHAEVRFSGEALDRHGADVATMWRMLCATGRDLELVQRDAAADDPRGHAHWEAR